jgi:hypothetical protein
MASHSDSTPTRIPFRTLPKASGAFLGALGLALVLGVAAVFLLGRSDAERMWRALHFNWIFWSGLSMGMVMFTVVMHVVNSRWSWSIRRFAMAGVSFLPVSFLLFLPILFLGKDALWHHWLHADPNDPVLAAKSGYLNFGFMAGRDLVGLLVLYGLSLYFAYLALRPDVYGAGQTESQKAWYGRLTGGWRGVTEEAMRSRKIMMRLGPILGLVYVIVWGMLAVDIAMSMLPHWFSTMFPVIFFIDAYHAGLAGIAVMMIVHRKKLGLESYITQAQFHDLGKLIFAFATFWMYINWSQYVVIWYGLLPHEQEFFVQRFLPPFNRLSMAAVALIWVVPFFGLLSRAPKKIPAVLAGFGVIILLGHWLERFLITVPSVYEGETLSGALGLPEIAIALGMGALWYGCYTWFLRTFPILPSPASLATVPQPTLQVPVNAQPGF